MKILHTADWHIGQFKGPVVDGVNLRSQDTVKCLEYMVQVAIEEKPDIVCVSGDIFHQEQVGPVRYSDEMITATNIITSLAHFSKYVIVMRGTPNHDGAAQFRVLERMLLNIRNVDVVTEPGVIKTPWADIACLPGFDKQEFRAKFPGLSADEENLAWTKYISDMVFALRAECEKTPILMAHYTVPGCNMESGQTSFFTNFEPVIPREALMAARYTELRSPAHYNNLLSNLPYDQQSSFEPSSQSLLHLLLHKRENCFSTLQETPVPIQVSFFLTASSNNPGTIYQKGFPDLFLLLRVLAVLCTA